MNVCVSANVSEKKRVYHKQGCIYERRIKYQNKMQVTEEIAIKNRYRECKYCAGLKGELRAYAHQIDKWKISEHIGTSYDAVTDTLYITTDIGAWKIFMNRKGKYVLFHMNQYSKDMSFYQIKKADYHCQKDVKATDSFEKIMRYIINHDKAKVIIMDDYRKLPRRTKKQKMYYKNAEQKAKRKQKYRVYELFARLERNDPELIKLSMC
ncbi:MAG: hypothetical protein K6G76_09870 [Lachnospiraceae bacterium]|nr:hypothetical protein [Lachnospiraceae bacterium]